MRAFICTDYRGKLYRVVWLTESSAGVYLGYYHKRHEVHASYHVDGAFHLTFLGKRLPSPFSEKKLPIDAIKTEQPLMGQSATYTQQGMDMFLPFTRDARTSTLIVMSHVLWERIGVMAMDSSIIHSDYEADFIRKTQADFQTESFDLIAVNLFRLDNFPRHKAAVVFYRGKGKQSDKLP